MMGNLAEGLQKEIKRNQNLLIHFNIFPTIKILIQADIDFTIKAMAEGNIVNELLAYDRLKKNEG